MLTPREIRGTDFERIVRGYNPEDVDAFLSQIADQVEQLEKDKDAAEKKMMVLAEKVDEMRAEGDTLRSVLVSAEKLKEQILTEAKETADTSVAEAQAKADGLVAEAQAKYDSIIGSIAAQSAKEEATLRALKEQVSTFKHTIQDLYRKHLKVLNELPEYDLAPAPAAPAPAPVAAPVAAPVVEEPVLTMPAELETAPEMVMPQMPAAEEPKVEDFSFENFDLPATPAPAAAPELKEVKPESAFASFMAQDEADAKFSKLDFGESFTFGND